VSVISFSPRVAQALADHEPVVALESSVFAQGLPIPANADAARRMVAAIERVGAVPAISAVSAGKAGFGLTDEELARFLARDGVMKVSARDIPIAMLQGRDGATTVAGALSLMALSPITVFATGGIGGVHREPQFDESADLAELARTPVIVVCAGAKSILDLHATMERLESLGVVVVGYRTKEMPGDLHERIVGRRDRPTLRLAAFARASAGNRRHAATASGACRPKGGNRARAGYGAR
jgi:pseudouridine-5'-phosphate glycosidase